MSSALKTMSQTWRPPAATTPYAVSAPSTPRLFNSDRKAVATGAGYLKDGAGVRRPGAGGDLQRAGPRGVDHPEGHAAAPAEELRVRRVLGLRALLALPLEGDLAGLPDRERAVGGPRRGQVILHTEGK